MYALLCSLIRKELCISCIVAILIMMGARALFDIFFVKLDIFEDICSQNVLLCGSSFSVNFKPFGMEIFSIFVEN